MLIHDHSGRRAGPPRPLLPFAPEGPGLRRGRVHELCGPARRTLAAMTLGVDRGEMDRDGMDPGGAVIWIAPGWQAERLMPHGLLPFADPGRLIFAHARTEVDLLWSMEEALRSGAAPIVVADLPFVPALTPLRRLQLATEAGSQRGAAPVGLILTPERGGAAGAESRWHLGHEPGGWHLARLRARMDPPASWRIRRDHGALRLESAREREEA